MVKRRQFDGDTEVAEQRRQADINRQSYINPMNGKPIVQCPYCHSANTTKITATSKAVNTALFGFLGTKRHKQWHCNQCKSDF